MVSIHDEFSDDLIEVFNDDVERGITMFLEENEIDKQTLRSSPQSMWTACLIFVHRHVLNDPMLLKDVPNLNNAYNFDKLNKLYDIYIYYCSLYNKVVSVDDYCRLTGIENDILQQWSDDNGIYRNGKEISEYTKKNGFAFLQKVRSDREKTLSAKIISLNNPVGLLGVANREFNWNQSASASAAIGYKPRQREMLETSTDAPVNAPQIPQYPTRKEP